MKKVNYLYVLLMILIFSCKSNNFIKGETEYQHYVDAGPHVIDQRIKLKNNNTFNFQNKTIFCDNILKGNYQVNKDTLILNVTDPGDYGGPLDYDVEYLEESNEQTIEIKTSPSIKDKTQIGFVHINNKEQMETLDYIDNSVFFKISKKDSIQKLHVTLWGDTNEQIEINLDKPEKRNLRITINSYPFRTCKISRISKYLIKNDTLFPIDNEELNEAVQFLKL